MTEKVVWTDFRGRKYVYDVFDFEDRWTDLPGNYIFAGRSNQGWVALFVGETSSFKKRFAARDSAMVRARNMGATHILAHVNMGGAKARGQEEQALIWAYDPPCNFPQQKGTVHLPDFAAARRQSAV